MKSRPWIVAASLVVLAASLYAADAVKLDGIKCPVAGKPAKDGTGVDYKGAKVYFCCMNCPKAFSADTAKFAVKANQQLVATKQAKQVKCPMTGKDINPEKIVKVDGVEVSFCCENCQGKVGAAKADEQPGLVFNDKAFEKGFAVTKK